MSPEQPEELKPGVPLAVPLQVGDNVLSGQAGGVVPEITLGLQVEGLASGQDLSVALNGQALAEGTLGKGWVEYEVAPELVKSGTNGFEITLDPGAEPGPVLHDLRLQISY